MKTTFIICLTFTPVLFGFQKEPINKEFLQANVYGNRVINKSIINYDKSFVSDDRLFYESLISTKTETPDQKLVKKTLQNYISGSSYNKLELIKSAFASNATLYLTGRQGFKRYTPEEYANFFKNGEAGKFNGREGRILEFEITKDIATAKVEIAGPKRKWVYIDLFLLKKIEGNWKIISKTATKVSEVKAN
ncbi:nuclear transport factor 2 family protein [Tenacibaculum aiptasiae]|uniref:Nuclear transport factor 2 family protein n=1 Tax=Tenacibaculum aiptasiae TaxID=426481 RepID=A0A7J5A6N1_9FLAO|nr:nuclear transport factor 2 family protein [Tenacibaculum aiptasiae]KAB1153221.1 nuclear transport factor 2 family protein [Tenacibaculum aiptasiae]